MRIPVDFADAGLDPRGDRWAAPRPGTPGRSAWPPPCGRTTRGGERAESEGRVGRGCRVERWSLDKKLIGRVEEWIEREKN